MSASLDPRNLLPVYVVFGQDDFLRRRHLESIARAVLGDDTQGMGRADFDGDTAELSAVLDDCRTPSLMAPTRMVCVRDADAFVSAHREAIERYIDMPSEAGVLVLVCRSWPKNTRLYKKVAALGGHLPCDPPRKDALPGWLIDRAAKAHNNKLTHSAAQRLADLVGDNLGRLDMELAKLATFVPGDKPIDIDTVDHLVGMSRQETVFGIIDAVALRDPRRALHLWEQVIATDKDAPYRAIGGLAYGVRKLIEAKQLVARGLSVGEARGRLRLYGSTTASLKRQLDRFTLRQWHDLLGRLLEIDVGAKTGLAPVPRAVESLIVELCSASKAQDAAPALR